eukprot:3806538-Ditylum_brightwellii.AAC.1
MKRINNGIKIKTPPQESKASSADSFNANLNSIRLYRNQPSSFKQVFEDFFIENKLISKHNKITSKI